jgi:hypothetical protein
LPFQTPVELIPTPEAAGCAGILSAPLESEGKVSCASKHCRPARQADANLFFQIADTFQVREAIGGQNPLFGP